MAGFIDMIAKQQKTQKVQINAVGEKSDLENLKKYICFLINGREYGIEISYVREIIEIEYIRKIIYTPSFLLGVVNLRGSIIAVMDLKNFFDLGSADIEKEKSRLIILNVEDRTIGFVVDEIKKIRHINPKDVQPSPATFNEIPDNYIIGMYKTIESNLLVLLNLLEIVNSLKIKELSKEVEE
jgi:purine-binding chemotaxis protein CheW